MILRNFKIIYKLLLVVMPLLIIMVFIVIYSFNNYADDVLNQSINNKTKQTTYLIKKLLHEYGEKALQMASEFADFPGLKDI